MHVEYTAVKLRGAKYKGDKVKYIKPGSELVLRRDLNNIYDTNAVLVLGVVPSEGVEPAPLGYLPKGLASKLAPQMDAGRTFNAVYVGGAEDFTPYLMVLAAGDGEELKLTRMKHR
ncbi:HIRAN domain-containing protein [Streptosporangium sp. NBC_01810]|uniref:HIRAN domain-containing protein n=1 Tax=Streptosporangium sp. NBC_01810 TaxID=2975951 RepID=UPI002DD9BBC9|nr:HIRAN domain-containing protein [Streptosporangium sp. NBC_01810]WSA23692.1 HIRAN domain-containing protein [Streptosporangium sp. NBC_01810]